ncbi:MAG: substrate-binding domain-containing protein, partial [Formosa sp.]|nr:substrate-binding domain-containing protein [Formosa sp.]
IGLITTKDYISVGRLRSLGYMNALKAHGVIPNSELILKVDDDMVSEDHLVVLEDEITQLFKVNPTIDAIFAVNELYAVTAMKVARELNINIPEQLQVIGFTDGVLSKHAWPSLSTVSQHGEEMGQQSAELLIRRIELSNDSETDDYKTIIIPTKLIERKSTL